MSMTQGGQIPGQPGLNHRRLAAGGSRRGGRARNRSSGAQSSRGGHARGAGARPHPERNAAAAGTDGARWKRARGGAGVQVFLATGLQWPWQRVHGTYSNYARRRACWTRRLGYLVAGAASAAGASGGGCGRAWCGRYGMRGRERRGGKRPAAHHGHDERVGEVGEELMKTGGRRRSRRPNDEDEVGGGASGRLASRESTERRRRRWRIPWACRRGEGEAMAAVVASGGDEPVRVGEGLVLGGTWGEAGGGYGLLETC